MNRAWLILESRRDAIFTATAATLGGHEGLGHVPGSTLLGWTAARLYDRMGKSDSFVAFHSGKLRFGDGWPLTITGAPAFPVAQCWRQRKRERGGVVADKVAIESVRNYQFGRFTEQAEPLKGVYVAADGSAASPVNGWRGKTAIEPGTRRAAEAQYFGYSHIRAGSRFAALLEADAGLDGTLWEQVIGLFRAAGEKGLRLGKSSGSEYGGDFAVEVVEAAGSPPWLTVLRADISGVLSVWCLSDLALECSDTLAPQFFPAASDLGFSGGRFCPEKSFITTRRYAPFNLKLDRFDAERCVIAAGSVLAFTDVPTGSLSAFQAGVGLWREAGLGRIWVAPLPLSGEKPAFSNSLRFATDRPSRCRPWPADTKKIQNDLKGWAEALMAEAGTRIGVDEIAKQWKVEVDRLLVALDKLDQPTPLPAQWGNIVELCRSRGKDAQKLKEAITHLCRKPEWKERAVVSAPPYSLVEWIESRPDQGGLSWIAALSLTADLVQKSLKDRGTAP